MIRLYIIDDHYLILDGFCCSFDLESDDFSVVGGSLDVADALTKISTESVDIIILDLFINNTDPILNLEEIRKAFPSIPVVILSQESCLMWQIEMFRHGVKAYINKGQEKSVLRQKLKWVYEGETVIPNEVIDLISKEKYSDHSFAFSSEGRTILSLILSGLVPKEIAKNLHQSESNIEKKLKRIREFYNVRNNYELILKLLHRQPSELNLMVRG